MVRFIVIITALFILQGCATILNGSKKQLSITSSEDGSKVTVIYEGNKVTGKNLVVIKAKKGTVTAIGEKKGCETVSRNIESSGDWGWYIAGNLFSWYVFGWIIDPITGGLWYYDQTEIDVTPICPDSDS